MTVQELIELLQQLPPDAQMYSGGYSGMSHLSADDLVVFYEHSPMKVVIPDYEWESGGITYMRLDEYLKERVNKD